jgi:hypothetical protein
MKIFMLIFAIVSSSIVCSQSFDEDKTVLSNYLKRMYLATPFEGVKILDDYDQKYLVSVISLEKSKYTTPSIMNRVAQVKAQSQASTFLNGATITMDMIIRTTEKSTKDTTEVIVQTVEIIKQNSMGFSKGLELLSNFESADGIRRVFIYYREVK